MFLIRVDRGSVRRNPNAGRRTQFVPSVSTVEATTCHPDGDHYRIDKWLVTAVKFDTDDSGRVKSWELENPYLMSTSISVTPMPDGEWVSVRETRSVQQYRTLNPDPDFLYDYLPTNVTCEECGATFDYTKLQSDWTCGHDDETWTDSMCPYCHTWDCCEARYENLSGEELVRLAGENEAR